MHQIDTFINSEPRTQEGSHGSKVESRQVSADGAQKRTAVRCMVLL